jgi:hypothetical protein
MPERRDGRMTLALVQRVASTEVVEIRWGSGVAIGLAG